MNCEWVRRFLFRATDAGAATTTADGPGPCPTCPTVLVMDEMAKGMSATMRRIAESQDKIGWRRFTEGCISKQFHRRQKTNILSTNDKQQTQWNRLDKTANIEDASNYTLSMDI